MSIKVQQGRVDLMVETINGMPQHHKIPNVKAYGKFWGMICRFFDKATEVKIGTEKVYVNTNSLFKHIKAYGHRRVPDPIHPNKNLSSYYKSLIIDQIKANPRSIDLSNVFAKAMEQTHFHRWPLYEKAPLFFGCGRKGGPVEHSLEE